MGKTTRSLDLRHWLQFVVLSIRSCLPSKKTKRLCWKISRRSAPMIFFEGVSKTEKGHGRIETRTLHTTTALNSYLNFPCVGQVFRTKRERQFPGKPDKTIEVVYGITSLTPQEAKRNFAMSVLRRVGYRNIASALRQMAANRPMALSLLGLSS